MKSVSAFFSSKVSIIVRAVYWESIRVTKAAALGLARPSLAWARSSSSIVEQA